MTAPLLPLLERMFVRRGGKDLTRPAVCERCGSNFRQLKLTERFLAIARRPAHKIGQSSAIDREIPDGHVPLFCPPCEHRDLGGTTTSVRVFLTPALELAYARDERAGLEEG